MIEIREERQEDYDAVRFVNNQAFGTPEEGRIVDKIREACKETISLVAVSGEKIVGHIFFSPAAIDHQDGQVVGMGLAPMAVLPEFQDQGIGSLLAKEGIRRIKAAGCPFIIVSGHANYYPRFGFERASKYGLKCQWEGLPDEGFMVMILNKSVMAGVSGVAKYRSEWDEAAFEVREEKQEDYDAVRFVNNQAFGTPEQGRIVDKIREACKETISLVVVSGKKIIGHIFFSPVAIDHEDKQVIGMGLAPLAVLPEFQKQDTGFFLVKEGLRRIKAADCPFIVVVGHETYFSRFGFERASKYGLRCQWDGVPDDAFLVLVLNKSAAAGISGVARYRSEFDKFGARQDFHI